MSDRDRTCWRDPLYSWWHRPDNVRRYLDRRAAWRLGLIDIDGCEYCRYCYQPLALIETQISENTPKAANVMRNLALLTESIPAFSVSVVPGHDSYERLTPQRDECLRAGRALKKAVDELGDDPIELFRVRQLAPVHETSVRDMNPQVFAYFLHSFRTRHELECPSRSGMETP